MVGLVTIAMSTYMITYSHTLFAIFEPLLNVFERRDTYREPVAKGEGETAAMGDIILFGLGRFGSAVGLRLQRRGIPVLGVDFNPQAVQRWRELGLEARFGDATDPEFLAELPLQRARWVVSTIPQHVTGLTVEDTRRTLIQLLRTAGFQGTVAVTSHGAKETSDLKRSGADLVLEPFQDAADRAVELLCGGETEERTEIPDIETEGRQLV
jgi:voltage-gated potassium channel Kch